MKRTALRTRSRGKPPVAGDVRAILAAGTGTPHPREAGDALVLELPVVPTRPLSDYAIDATSTGTPS